MKKQIKKIQKEIKELSFEYFLTSERYLKFKSEGRFDGSAEARSYMKTLSEDINNLLKQLKTLKKIKKMPKTFEKRKKGSKK